MKINLLVAYPYFTGETRAVLRDLPRSEYRLIVDSGAYSAWNSGHPITLDGYCKFLDTLADIGPDEVVQLDVFGDVKATWDNYLRMCERGYKTMPVFTRGADIALLEQMYERTDYIMFGGIVVGGKNKNYVRWWLDQNKGRKAHWLGFCDLDFIKAYRPASVDSTSWKSANLYGNLGVYQGFGRVQSVHRAEVQAGALARHAPLLRAVGCTDDIIWALRRDEAWVDDGKYIAGRDRCSAYFATALAHVARMVDVEAALGTRIYLAVAGVNHLPFLIKAWHHFKAHKEKTHGQRSLQHSASTGQRQHVVPDTVRSVAAGGVRVRSARRHRRG